MPRKDSRSSAMLIAPDHDSVDHRPVLPPNERRLSFGDKWSYAPAPEASNYIKLRPRYQLFINGKFVSPRSGNISNPSTRPMKKSWPKLPQPMAAILISPSNRPDEPTAKCGEKCPDASA